MTKSLHSKPRKWLLLFTLALAMTALVMEHRALYHRWLDETVSDFMTKQLDRPVNIVSARFQSWNRMRFGTLTVSSHDKQTLMAAGRGQIRFYGFFSRGVRARVMVYTFRDVAILESFYKKLPIISWIAQYIFHDPIYLDEMRLVMTQSHGETGIRILKFNSEEIWVMGGAHFKDKKLVRADLLVAVPNSSFEKLPKEVRSRMIKRKGGWRAVRVTFGGNVFTVEGAAGPFFRASWS